MKLKFTKQFVAMLACLMVAAAAFAQQRTPLDIATEHVRTHYSDWGLTAQDVDGITVSDQYTDPSTGVSRVFFMQAHRSIVVYNAILNVAMTKEGKVFHVGRRFVADLAAKANTSVPVLGAEAAIVKLMEHLELPYEPLRAKGQDEKGFLVFDKGNIAKQDIKARLSYQPYGDAVLLAWDIAIAPLKSADMWSTRVDAVVGSILDETNWTVYCKVDGLSFGHDHHDCEAIERKTHEASKTASLGMAAEGTYNVWPWPVESPIHGDRQLVVDPHDTGASPYAWHDTNGQPGAEYTITRGNNVHAYEDSDADDVPADNEPDGGASLVFDFPFDPATEPAAYTNAAVVNLFYWNNVMHDFAYNYGFTEAAGNFQSNNYGNGGAGNDYVLAQAQDGSGTDNANFATPPDGNSGAMQMFLWGSGGSQEIFNVLEPASISGPYSSAQPGTGWGTGAYATETGVEGEVIVVEDAVANDLFSDACEQIVNGADLTGKIAIIDRGGCEFGFKALSAQNAGAIGVIICNFDDGTIGMAAGASGAQVNIPVIMITSVHCQTIRQFAGNGLRASIKVPSTGGGPSQLDGDLDNGIVAHEYGHGISNRLTGGPSSAGCLGNAEQMGEGWSDWFSLVTSVEAGDAGTDKRGIGNYAVSLPAEGSGIRRYPYSTDMTINPLTYADVAANTEVHALGEVWTAMTWDLYWAFVEEYGWDEDLYHGTGGNNMAIRLVFEGMANQPCGPGFLDGRNAIIAADQALYGGANKCLIWKVFARRGAGETAIQGSADDATDQVAAFDVPCECRDEVTVTKSVTNFIQAGDEITVTVDVANCKLEPRTNVVIKDELPEGTTYKAGSASVPATVNGNTLSLSIGDFNFEETKTVTYVLQTDPNKSSIQYWLDDVPTEDAEDNWEYTYEANAPSINIFSIQDVIANSPDYAWYAPSIATESRAILELVTPWKVKGERPTLRFYHRYETENGVDAGFIEVKKAGEPTYQKVADKMLRNGYTGGVTYGEAFIIPNLVAWSGSSGGEFVDSYVDLSSWQDQDVVFRFRYGTNEGAEDNLGWVVDDIEFMDLLAYNSEACLTSDQGDNVCAIAPEEGTIVDSKLGVNGTTETLNDLSMTVYPNPVQDLLNVAINAETLQEVNLSLVTIEGKLVADRKFQVQGKQQMLMNVSQLPAGFYFVKLSTAKGVVVTKVVVE